MSRLLLVFLFFAVAVNPEFRKRAAPHAQWLLRPAHEWMVRSRVAEIARALEAESAANRALPTSATLPAFLAEHYRTSDAGADPWDTPYFLVRDAWTLRVASAGPDRAPVTADDILSPPVLQPAR
jgi:hypothetical protein